MVFKTLIQPCIKQSVHGAPSSGPNLKERYKGLEADTGKTIKMTRIIEYLNFLKGKRVVSMVPREKRKAMV